jgi:hypothetical protein
MPNAFMENQDVWEPGYFRTDQQVAQFFNAHNITVYNNQHSGGLNYPAHNTETGGLPNGQLDVWWDEIEFDTGAFGRIFLPALGISYETQHWFLGIWQYWTSERLHYTSLKSGTQRGDYVFKSNLQDDFEIFKNGTAYSARCNSGIQVTILYSGNETDIGDSWDNGQLQYMMSWELNATATSINMFTLLGQILTFQAPVLGVPGIFGSILNAIIAIPLYATIGYLIYKFIVGIAPWLSGGSGD